MTKYNRILSLFSYIFGFISIMAILTDRKDDRLYSFYILQAFFVNLFLILIFLPFYILFLPDYILSLEVHLRTSFFLKATLIPAGFIFTLLPILGIMSYMEIKFQIPLIGNIARKLSRYEAK